MELYALEFPLSPSDLESLERTLEHAAIFRTSFDDLGSESYCATTYRVEAAAHGIESRLLADRNIISRIVGLVRGERATEAHRIAAAALAFAQCANMLVEPNLALYELAQSTSPREAQAELGLFYIADEVDPRLYVDIALRRREFLPADLIPRDRPLRPLVEDPPDFSMPLKRWRSDYILALKLSVLELQGGTAETKMHRFIDWMRDEFVFGASATVFALHYFAPGMRKRRMFKSLPSADRQLALRGIRNAAWDLTLASDWAQRVQRQKQDKRLWVLCSRDTSIRRIAADLIGPEGSEITTERLAEALFKRHWGSVVGCRLFQHYLAASAKLSEPERAEHGFRAMQAKSHLVEVLEAEIAVWRPA